MYVAVENSESVNKYDVASKSVLQNLECTAEVNFIHNDGDVEFADIESVIAQVLPFKYDLKDISRDTCTYRQVSRKASVVEVINTKGIEHVSVIRSIIQRSEKEQGYKDEVCFKSVARILHQLETKNVVRLFDICLNCKGDTRIYRYVTHAKIDEHHDIMKREIFKLKNAHYLAVEEKRLRNEMQMKERMRRLLKSAKKSGKDKKTKDLLTVRSHKPPKFLISRYMHEFLFYIVVELNEYQTQYTITEDLLQKWQLMEPNLNIKDFLEQLTPEEQKQIAYTQNISWRTFIPPLPRYSDKPAGWVYFIDAIERMPLSLFQKIFCFESNERLSAYLTHPVRQHYLLRQLPIELQNQISRIQLQRLYITVLKLLNNMGLIQVSERHNVKDPLVMWLYLNRHAQILDTTTTEASYNKINSDRIYETMNFEFSTFDDLHQYWTNLHRICIYTKLGFRRGKSEKIERSKELGFLQSVDFDEAPYHDNGTLPGDKLGAAGLSTSLFAHTFRNWSWVVHTNITPNAKRTGRSSQAVRDKYTKLIQHKNQRNRLIMPPLRLQHGSVAKAISAKKTGARDAIDRDALKNMRTLRVSWRAEEDYLLKISRAVYLYVAAPVPALGLLTVGKICRDIMRHTLGSNNKTMQACVRRTQFLLRMNRHLPEVPAWLNLLQSNTYIQSIYSDNFLQKLKAAYPNRTDFCDALATHFILIMHFLYKIVRKVDFINSEKFLIPDTIKEFNAKFEERTNLINNAIQNLNPTNEFELQVAVIINVLHSSMCCAKDKTLYNLQAFEIYKNYSEEVLHAAFTKARLDTLVVTVKRRNLQLIPDQLAGPTYLLSAKYRLRLIYLKIPYILYDALYNYFETALKTFFQKNNAEESSKQYLELKSPNMGHLIFIGEGITNNYWHTNVVLPINILTVDMQQSQNLSSMDRILNHYHTIFDNAPQTEYAKTIENESTEKRIRIKFHPANLSYKIQYAPYDIISKLPSRYLHFFCALRHLDKEVEINFSKLCRDDEENNCIIIDCPFNCIMDSANYIDAIESIVKEKSYILNELSEMPPQKLLNMAASHCSVTVDPTNILTLVRMMESFWREKELKNELKDLGKIQSNLKSTKPIDWNQLCRSILEFNSDEYDLNHIDEHEPILNKEERTLRAQDVFVVNLPTLQFSLHSDLKNTKNMVTRNSLQVPKILLETEIEREKILRKIMDESYWKSTDNTFELLQTTLDEHNLTDTEKTQLEEIHNFIEVHEMGVTVTDLLLKFTNVQFLQRALHILSDFYLIKRVGVSSFMYVHKNHIRHWLINTFHIKRLEREKLGDIATCIKRSHADTETGSTTDTTADISNKKVKLNESAELVASALDMEPSTSKRVSKPVKPFDTPAAIKTVTNDITKHTIIMKPQPWMRLNGSLNRRVLDRWLGSILAECVARCGCCVLDICERFPHMYAADVLFLLEILSDLKCVRLTQIDAPEVDIFSDYENIKETIVTELYKPTQTYIRTHADALTRMAVFIGKKKYSSEFI